MRRGPNPKPFLIMMVATLLVSSGLAYMQYSKLGEVNAEVNQLKKEQLDEKDVQKQLDEATGKLAASKVELSHLEQGVPEVAYVPTLLKELEKTGKESGVEVLGVRPIPRAATVSTTPKSGGEKTKASKKPDYTELDIQVNARGDYKSVQKFVKAIQLFPKILATRTVSVMPAQMMNEEKAKGGSPKLTVGFEFRAYLFPSDGSTKKAEAEEEAPKEKTINISGRNTGVN